MKITRPTAILLLAGLLALGAGCSSSSDDTASGGGASTTAAGASDAGGSSDKGGDNGSESQAVKAPDVCPDVDTAALSEAGVPTTGEATSYPGPPGTAIGVCTFGTLVDPKGAVVVQVENKSKDAIVDPLLTVLKNASQEAPTAASQPDGAKVYALALIPGGGGVGKSVAWESDEHVVVAAQTGESVDPAPLEKIVAGIVDKF